MKQQVGPLTEASWGTSIKYLGIRLMISLDEAALIDLNLQPIVNLTMYRAVAASFLDWQSDGFKDENSSEIYLYI